MAPQEKTFIIIATLFIIGFMWMVSNIAITNIHGHYFEDNDVRKSELEQKCLDNGGVPIRSRWDGRFEDCREPTVPLKD